MPNATRPSSTPTSRPAPGRSSGRRGAPSPAATDALPSSTVCEGATRATIAVGLGALVAIHAVDAVGKWTETRYVFWLYMAAIAAAIAAAGWTLFTRSRTALLASAAVAGGVLLGYVVNRTLGLPNAIEDIGNWTEPLGIASVVVETATVMVAVGAYTLSGRARV